MDTWWTCLLSLSVTTRTATYPRAFILGGATLCAPNSSKVFLTDRLHFTPLRFGLISFFYRLGISGGWTDDVFTLPALAGPFQPLPPWKAKATWHSPSWVKLHMAI